MRLLNTAAIIITLALVAACAEGSVSPQSNDGLSFVGTDKAPRHVLAAAKGDGWLPSDAPSLFDTDLEYTLSALPADGAAAITPWTGSYWPVYQDSVAARWDGATSQSPAAKYGEAFGVEGVEDAVSRYHGIDSRSSAKTCTDDSTCDDAIGEVCSKRHGESEGRCIPTWFGLCHAWAPATILEAEPIHPVVRNGVEFKVNDIKALLTLVYNRSSAKMLSLRCNEDEEAGDIEYDVFGNPTGEDAECKDTNAGTFHVVVANYLGLKGESFVEDRTFDDEVWNQPLSGYRVTRMEEVSAQQANELAGATAHDVTRETFDGAVASGAWEHFSAVPVPAGGTVRVAMNGDGDPDVYVRLGAHPDHQNWDCRPYAPGADETCTVTAGDTDTELFISVFGYTASSHFDLVVDVTSSVEATPALLDETRTGSVGQNVWHAAGTYTLTKGSTARVVMTGSGDPDLYIRLGAEPTVDTWDCRPWANGAEETCTLNATEDTEMFVVVHGYSPGDFDLAITVEAASEAPYVFNADAVSFYDVRLELDYITESPSWMDGNLSESISSYTNTDVYTYVLEVDAAGQIIGGEWTGDSKRAHPDFLWLPIGRLADPVAGGKVSYEDVKSLLEESLAGAPTVEDETFQTHGNLAVGEWAHFGPFEVTSGTLEAKLTGTGDADLYVRRGAEPTLFSYDCRPYRNGSVESCSMTGAGPVYVSVHGYAASMYSLSVAYTTVGSEVEPSVEPTEPATPEPAHLDTGDTVEHGEMRTYTLPVFAGQTVRVETTAPHDVDLYLRMAVAPTQTDFDARAWSTSGDEVLTYTVAAHGVLHIGVFGYAASSFTLTTSDG